MGLYIVRHGESFSNVSGKVMSTTDLPLTEKGIKQAEAAKEYLQEIVFDRIFSSHLIRARQTAEIISRGKGEIEIREDLHEMFLGKIEGLTWEERNELYPDADIAGSLSKAMIPEGESFEALVARCSIFINDKLKPCDMSENILIVSHGITKRVLINCLLEKPIHYVDYINWADNTAITEIDLVTKTIIRLNDRKHLTDLGLGNSNYEEWGLFSSQEYTQL